MAVAISFCFQKAFECKHYIETGIPRFTRWTSMRGYTRKSQWLSPFLFAFKKLLNANIQRFFQAKSQSFPIGFS
jgi:hypothetical protein